MLMASLAWNSVGFETHWLQQLMSAMSKIKKTAGLVFNLAQSGAVFDTIGTLYMYFSQTNEG